jgi:hypothetical protein
VAKIFSPENETFEGMKARKTAPKNTRGTHRNRHQNAVGKSSSYEGEFDAEEKLTSYFSEDNKQYVKKSKGADEEG